ncbi:flagellin [Bacillus ectoiniformans]|uniref:flagellinolysin n=1 Tax=Bacillus ectoiniformans TaxID=1494429 RepID=UPI0019566988|nr:flagellinolysin [Bacillus ectoiniformans]MBM7649374.1 flagellin [Bacillus ectoiniformans]
MKINHNFTALNTHNRLAFASSQLMKSSEKLSSGLRINKAGDDAAGLAISEKMRGQIRGLDQASRNANDAISMIQTAEGASSVVHDMLQRGRELAVQAANDTLTDFDRSALNKELSQIKEQINKVANDTEFNTIKILNKGSLSSSNAGLMATVKDRLANWVDDSLSVISTNLGLDITFGTPKDMKVEFYENPAGPAAASMGTNDGGNTLILRINMSKVEQVYNSSDYGWGQVDALIAHEMVHALQFTKMSETLNGGIDTWFIEGMATAIQGGVPFLNNHSPMSSASIPTGSTWTGDYGSAYAAVMTLHETTTGGLSAIIDRLEAGDTLSEAIAGTTQVSTAEISNVTDFTNTTTAAADFAAWFNSSADVNTYLDGSTDFDNPIGTIGSGQGTIRSGVTSWEGVITNNETIENGSPFNLIFPDEADLGETVVFHIDANSSQTLKINTVDITSEGLAISTADLSNRINAEQAIDILDSAIGKISAVRSTFGAAQNRLEYTINNLNNASENVTASESRIRDVDMVKEMMNQTRSSILTQAAQAMLAQANQQPQGVLQLLR